MIEPQQEARRAPTGGAFLIEERGDDPAHDGDRQDRHSGMRDRRTRNAMGSGQLIC